MITISRLALLALPPIIRCYRRTLIEVYTSVVVLQLRLNINIDFLGVLADTCQFRQHRALRVSAFNSNVMMDDFFSVDLVVLF